MQIRALEQRQAADGMSQGHSQEWEELEDIDMDENSQMQSYDHRINSLVPNFDSPNYSDRELNPQHPDYKIRVISPQPSLKKHRSLMSKAPKPQSRSTQIMSSVGDVDEAGQVTTLHYGTAKNLCDSSLLEKGATKEEDSLLLFLPSKKLLIHQGSLDSGFLCHYDDSPRKDQRKKEEGRILPRNFSSIIYH